METVIPESVPNGIITFPMLGDNFKITAPSSFEVFGLTIHWYGVIIAVGFLLAYLYVNYWLIKRLGFTGDDLIDYLICGVIGGVIGARIYYVVFNYDMFRDDFWSIFKIWNGGLAFYGTLIGAVLVLYIGARIKKQPFAPVLDAASCGLIIGQIVGRWGNFMNREAYGTATDIFCRMGLTNSAGETIYVHPTFLYESLWNLVGFLILHFFIKSGKRKYDGQIFLIYLGWYGLGRAMIEGLRSDSLYLFNTGLRVSQVLAALTCLASVILLCWNGSRTHPPEKLYVNVRAAKEKENAEASEAAAAAEAPEASEPAERSGSTEFPEAGETPETADASETSGHTGPSEPIKTAEKTEG